MRLPPWPAFRVEASRTRGLNRPSLADQARKSKAQLLLQRLAALRGVPEDMPSYEEALTAFAETRSLLARAEDAMQNAVQVGDKMQKMLG